MFGAQKIGLRQSFGATLINAVCHGFTVIARLPALIFDIPLYSFARKISDKERQTIIDTLVIGDILLMTDKLFPLWQLAVSATGSPRYSHAALYEGNNRVVEATTFHASGNGVGHTDVDDFLSGRKNICVVRPAYPSEYHKNVMLAWLKQQLGKSYDYGFNPKNEDTMYCAKLVAKAMRIAGFPVGTRRFLWGNLYLPDTFTQMAGMDVIYRKAETPAGKLVHLLPLVLAVSIGLTGVAPLLGFCAFLLAAGWLQHLKMM